MTGPLDQLKAPRPSVVFYGATFIVDIYVDDETEIPAFKTLGDIRCSGYEFMIFRRPTAATVKDCGGKRVVSAPRRLAALQLT